MISRLADIIKESIEIASEIFPLTTKIPLERLPLNELENLMRLMKWLLKQSDDIVISNEISSSELAQNSYEFIDNSRCILLIMATHSDSMDKEYFTFLQSRVDKLISELNAPPFLQHRKRTPEDSTEPVRAFKCLSVSQ
jgi:hypothetical protein